MGFLLKMPAARGSCLLSRLIVSNGWREGKSANRLNGDGRRAGDAWPMSNQRDWCSREVQDAAAATGKRPPRPMTRRTSMLVRSPCNTARAWSVPQGADQAALMDGVTAGSRHLARMGLLMPGPRGA